MRTILELLPENQRLNALKASRKTLSEVLKKPKSLKAILNLLPEEQRVLAVKITNSLGETMLEQSLFYPSLFRIILEAFPHQQDELIADLEELLIQAASKNKKYSVQTLCELEGNNRPDNAAIKEAIGQTSDATIISLLARQSLIIFAFSTGYNNNLPSCPI